MRIAYAEQAASDIYRQIQHGNSRQIADVEIAAGGTRRDDVVLAWRCGAELNGAKVGPQRHFATGAIGGER